MEQLMSIRHKASQIINEVEEAVHRNPTSMPNDQLVSRVKQLLTEGKAYFISDFHPELDWRRWPVPQQWTLDSIRALASAIHETARKHDNALAPALAAWRLRGI
jgi:hypothetical protein